MVMATIVLATDLSDQARSAAVWAFDWARRQPAGSACIVVVHIVSAEELTMAQLEQGALAHLTREVADWLEPYDKGDTAVDIGVDIKVHAGSVIAGIIWVCDEEQADWLVLSMSGKGALGRLFLGSTASRIVH